MSARRALAGLLAACCAAVAAGPARAAAPASAPRAPSASHTQTVRGAAAAKLPPLLPLTQAQVLTHVRRTISWYHEIGAVEQLALPGVDRTARERLQQQGLYAVRLAFGFGYAAAGVLARAQPGAAPGVRAAPASAANTFAAQLSQASASLAGREDAVRSQLAALDGQLRRVRTARERAALLARRGDLTAGLDLLKQIESNLGQMRRFQTSTLGGRKLAGLRGKLADLENSLPELGSGGPQPGTPTAAAAPGAATSVPRQPPRVSFRPESAGIVALIGEWFTLHRSDMQLDTTLSDTNSLESELQAVRAQVLGRVHELVGGALATIGSGGLQPLAAGQRSQIESATGDLKVLSGVLVPLGEQALTLGSAHSVLDGWSSAVIAQESTVASYLGLRIGFVLALVAAVLVVSEIWRRATFRYLPDARRRRPFLVLRRLLVWLALALIVIFGLVSQVGSVATYAGFVTAGLAVALQNVILAVVAYFFLIGRYGVRVGDRISISGVTGRVVDISLLRLYLLELSGPDLHSTGRLVVFSNAVLFQPAALFKQIPGADYFWHSVTLTIVSTADVDEAHRRLETAARQVYATYRATIDRQHAQAHRFIEFETATPEPEVRMRLTDSGLQCEVRYPVASPEKSARIDQQMLAALREALDHDQQFQLVASGGVALKSDL